MANQTGTDYVGALDNKVPTIVSISINVILIIVLLYVLALNCMKQMRLQWVAEMVILEIFSMVLFLVASIFFLYAVVLPENMEQELSGIVRTLVMGAWMFVNSVVLWKFATKYGLIAKELPIMYQGTISHLQISRRWQIISTLYYSMSFIFSCTSSYYGYFFIECQTSPENDNKCN